ncbi:VanZ family protein [Microbacterium sp. NPDC008134]|uniref:VanZ family protein n=1 Tax=Microbacterium sp. NPDC008134 TaxID=3364183 RepID=UPI0036E94EAE
MGSLLPPPRRGTRAWALGLGIPFLAGLVALTLTPSRVEQRMPNLLDVILSTVHRLGWASLDFTRLEILANVLVFVPVGILAFVLLPRPAWGLAFLVGPAISIGIEVFQRIALPHRAATVSDVIANSTGSTIGVVLAVLSTFLVAVLSGPSPSRRLEAS